MTFVDPIGKFRWIVGRGIFMEGNQSAYYGQYYIPLQNLEQEILQWLRKLVDAYAKQAGETPVEHIRSRIKTAEGMQEKLHKKGFETTADSALANVSDIVGFRLVTHFVGEVYDIVERMKQDERFMDYGGKLAPKSKADYAFLLHGFYHLKQTGTMAIVLPHGVLFRGAAEGAIRETLLKNGSIYAVIGLPANMFYNTSIPTCIVVLKKHREGRDVLFIDASNLYEKEKKQNVMNEEHIDKVLELYNNRKSVDKLAYLASYEDIKANDYNLNIPRYVDTSEEEDEIDIKALTDSIKETNKAIKESNTVLVDMLNNLTFSSSETETAINEFIEILKEV